MHVALDVVISKYFHFSVEETILEESGDGECCSNCCRGCPAKRTRDVAQFEKRPVNAIIFCHQRLVCDVICLPTLWCRVECKPSEMYFVSVAGDDLAPESTGRYTFCSVDGGSKRKGEGGQDSLYDLMANNL